MSKFEGIRSKAEKEFGSDPNESAVAGRAVDFLEDWSKMASCDGCGLNIFSKWKRRRECSAFIEAGLYKAREEEHGFLGALLTAVAFQILVQVIVKWVMSKFFDE